MSVWGVPWPAVLRVKGETCLPRLTSYRYGDNRAGSLIEDVLAEYENGPVAALFVSTCWIEIRPIDVASRYSGHSDKVSGDTLVGHGLLELRIEFAAFTRESASAKALQLLLDGFPNGTASAGVDTLADEAIEVIKGLFVQANRDFCLVHEHLLTRLRLRPTRREF